MLSTLPEGYSYNNIKKPYNMKYYTHIKHYYYYIFIKFFPTWIALGRLPNNWPGCHKWHVHTSSCLWPVVLNRDCGALKSTDVWRPGRDSENIELYSLIFSNYGLHSILFCVSFRHTAQQTDTYIGSKAFPPIIRAPTWHQSPQYCRLLPTPHHFIYPTPQHPSTLASISLNWGFKSSLWVLMCSQGWEALC